MTSMLCGVWSSVRTRCQRGGVNTRVVWAPRVGPFAASAAAHSIARRKERGVRYQPRGVRVARHGRTPSEPRDTAHGRRAVPRGWGHRQDRR
eukprot:3506425-Prymnesium_polylepis.1